MSAEPQADIALIGLAVMGQNLILNMNDHGFKVVAYNRTVSKVDEFLAKEAKGTEIVGAHSIAEMCAKLKKPRRVMMLVKETLTWRRMRFRHQVGNVRVDEAAGALLAVRANFTVHQSDNDGVPSLYMVGYYDATMVRIGDALKLRRMHAVVDSFGVDNMLAMPL